MTRSEKAHKKWERVAALYAKLGTQEAVGEKLGVTKQAVNAILQKARAAGIDVARPEHKPKPRPPVPDTGMCKRHPRRKRVFGSPYCKACKAERARRNKEYREQRARAST